MAEAHEPGQALIEERHDRVVGKAWIAGKLALVQVDPEYVFSKTERGRPAIFHLDNDAFRADGYLRVTHPISASFAICDVTLPKLRYVCNPELPALQGIAKLAA